MAHARPLDAQQSLVQTQSTVKCESVNERGGISPHRVVSRTRRDSSHEHQISPELDGWVSAIKRHLQLNGIYSQRA